MIIYIAHILENFIKPVKVKKSLNFYCDWQLYLNFIYLKINQELFLQFELNFMKPKKN